VLFPDSNPIVINAVIPIAIRRTATSYAYLPNPQSFRILMKYDKPEQSIKDEIPCRVYFVAGDIGKLKKLRVRDEWDDFFGYARPLTDWLGLKTYPNPADLVQVEIDPETPEVFEGQDFKFTGKITPKDGLGTGEFTETSKTLDLLDGYQAQTLTSLDWKALLLPPQTPVKQGQNWEFAFQPKDGTGTYEVIASTVVEVKEKDTKTSAKVAGISSTTAIVKDGLRIISPIDGFSYPLGFPIKVLTSLDENPDDWDKIQWFLDNQPWLPAPTQPQPNLVLDKPGNHKLKAVYKPSVPALNGINGPPVELSHVVSFSMKAMKVSIDPVRKVMPYSENLSLSLQAKVEFEGHPAIVDSEKPLDLGGKVTAKVTKVEWQTITDPPGGVTSVIEQNQLTPKLEIKSACAVTALATVTVVVSKILNAQTIEEPYVLPSVRADLWALSPPLLTAVDGHLPSNGIVGAGRTFEVATCSFKIGSLDCNWSSKTGFSPGVSFQPAQPGVASVSAAGLAFSWKGPNKPITEDPIFVPVFPTPGSISVDLSIDLEFFQDGKFPLGKKPFIVDVRPIGDWLAKKIVPASFSLVLGQKEKFEFTYSLNPPIDKEFQIASPAFEWLQNSQVIGKTNPFEYTAQGSGTVAIEAKADFSFVEKDFIPPAPDGHGSVIDGISGKVKTITLGLKEVAFTGGHYHAVKMDDGTQDYVAPHWQDNSSPLDGDADDSSDKKYPISFTRNTKMKISAKWLISPSGLTIPIMIKGDGPGNLDFPETLATMSSNELTLTDVECSNPFENEVDFFDPLSINWQFSIDGGLTWRDAGTSANQTYVTLGDPLTTVFRTLAHLGCKNADGEDTSSACTAKIWEEFIDRDVRRIDGVQLTYYASYNCANVTTADLLAQGDGQCGAWAKFFIDMRKVQGIDDLNEYVIFEPIIDDGFIVKNWSFTSPGSSSIASYPFLNIPGYPLVMPTSYNWKFSEVNDDPGIPGQGNPNPASLFSNHQVVISGEYYDPSYGLRHANLQEIDDNAIDGFYKGPGQLPVDEPVVNQDLNGDGDKVDLGVITTAIIFRANPPGLDIKETKLDY
jgi:hypothetical protein